MNYFGQTAKKRWKPQKPTWSEQAGWQRLCVPRMGLSPQHSSSDFQKQKQIAEQIHMQHYYDVN